MTYEEWKDMQDRLKNGETVYFSESDYGDIIRFNNMSRKDQVLLSLMESAVNENWDEFCSIAQLNYEVMPEAFRYYDQLPKKYRRDFVINCYMHHGDRVSGCRKAVRGLPKNGINELPPEYAVLPEITVYRAGEEELKKAPYRLSWTLDIDIAHFFLYEYKGAHASHLYKATIKPCDVIAYTDDREEQEVLQYRYVYNIIELESR